MEKTRLMFDQVELLHWNHPTTKRLLEDRINILLQKCPVYISGEGKVIAYGNPSPYEMVYLSPRKDTEIVEVNSPSDISQGRVTKADNEYSVKIGRTNQDLDSPYTIFSNFDIGRNISTAIINKFVPPVNY